MDIYIPYLLQMLHFPSRLKQFEMKNFLLRPAMVSLYIRNKEKKSGKNSTLEKLKVMYSPVPNCKGVVIAEMSCEKSPKSMRMT